MDTQIRPRTPKPRVRLERRYYVNSFGAVKLGWQITIRSPRSYYRYCTYVCSHPGGAWKDLRRAWPTHGEALSNA